MQTRPSCLPCLLRQVTEAAALATEDAVLRERIVRDALAALAEMEYDAAPPELAMVLMERVNRIGGNPDPYASIKETFNRRALDGLDAAREAVRAAPDPLDAALRLAVAGNIIDFGVPDQAGAHRFEETLAEALEVDFAIDHLPAFRQRLESAERVLLLADNAGEIVFDRLLAERLAPRRVTAAVKSGPILNDATRRDAVTVGLEEVATVVETGQALPGLRRAHASEELAHAWREADVILSKGQGNFETLHEEADARVLFLFRVKCPVVAELTAAPLGAWIRYAHGA